MNKYIVRVETKGHGANAYVEAFNERQASAQAKEMLAMQACCNKSKIKVRNIKQVEEF